MDVTKCIREYVSFIQFFENTIKEKYNLQNSIYSHINIMFENKGTVKDFDYLFHGAGCRVIKNKIICEYDCLNYEDNPSYQFSLWKLKTFIESFYQTSLDETKLKQEIEELVANGFLEKLKIEERIFDIYRVACNINEQNLGTT